MKITAVRATPVNIPLDRPYLWTGGLYPGTSKTIIEIETDAGLVGLGEAPSDDFTPLIRRLGERLIGQDPLDIAHLERRCVPPWQIVQNTDGNAAVVAFGSIEIALWDIRGKAWNQPVYQLLGGAVRRQIPFTEYFAFRVDPDELEPEDIVDYCLRMRAEHGSTLFEGKVIRGDVAREIRTVRLLREALGPAAMLRLDANMQYSLATARAVVRALEPYNIRNFEDPVGTFEELAALRQHTAIPFSAHVPDLRRAVALGVPDTIVTNFAVLGGINRAIRFIGACEAMGVGFWCYSGDAGICTAAYLHVSAATQHIHEPSQALFRWQIADVIVGGPFQLKDNLVPVPDGPGLGVELDRAALQRWHQHYLDHGPLDHYTNPARPGYYTRLPQA
ncbi:MAG: mandelate racemase/muconate lactonizing enzyme family protein [Anaerolineales bacterium]|nr:mandelate racemase/muconate lactonizing enzyme family protein [Anaerolineales bacterium]